ncbi:MAG: polyphosphate glucokinase [Bacteroidia bacterium]|nr:MAG: polyphosphate glucokinase [Bacteroidia bacterium]
MEVLGIDIGGSGIKGAIVDTKKGKLIAERHRIPTPELSTPENVAEVVRKIVKHFNWKGPIGCGFPAVIQGGVAKTASNVDKKWIGTNVNTLFSVATSCPVKVINDADAAGYAEMEYGAGKNAEGVVLLVTIGTGIGTALFANKTLVPNTELGHIEMNGKEAERQASDAVRKKLKLKWKNWAVIFDEYLLTIEKLLWPDLIIIGGGASKKKDKFFKYLSCKAKITEAQLLNNAGIIGAAVAASRV